MTKVMVVDDDLVVLATICTGLRHAGYEVLQVDSGELAIQICHREKPDLAILDVCMPGMSGIEVAQALKQEGGPPFIFLSAFNDEEIVQTAAKTGALGYLVKPVKIARIVPAIEIALARAEELDKLALNNTNLLQALEHNREIDLAVGLIMGRHRLDRATAFEVLRTYARNQRCKIAEVAKRMLSSEDLSSSG